MAKYPYTGFMDCQDEMGLIPEQGHCLGQSGFREVRPVAVPIKITPEVWNGL